MRPFNATTDATVNIDVSSSTQRVKLTRSDGCLEMRVYNAGTQDVWIKVGDSTVTADSTKNMPIPAGAVEVLNVIPPRSDDIYVAAIAAGSTGKVYFTPGVGI
jgi:hypothetical protein